jgi:tetratricopeptide (TPR) repeat protein
MQQQEVARRKVSEWRLSRWAPGLGALSVFTPNLGDLQRSGNTTRARRHGGDREDRRPLVTIGCVALICFALTTYGQQPRRPVVQNQVKQLILSAQRAEEQGRLDDAIRDYTRAATLPATREVLAAAHFKLGNIYIIQRKFENARAAFQRSVSLNPGNAEAYNNLGEALGELKRFREAIDAFSKAGALDPKLLKARYNQGVTYDRLGNRRYAEFVFRNLIKLAPDYSLGYDGLAVTLSKSGRGKEAIPLHEKAISLNPKDPSFYFNLASSYLILGDTAKAVEQQEKLKQIDPAAADQLASVIVKRKL